MIALKSLGSYLTKDLKSEKLSIEDAVNCFVITFELPNLGCSDYFEIALPDVCLAIGELPIKGMNKIYIRLQEYPNKIFHSTDWLYCCSDSCHGNAFKIGSWGGRHHLKKYYFIHLEYTFK